jgi:hypothetical protein
MASRYVTPPKVAIICLNLFWPQPSTFRGHGRMYTAIVRFLPCFPAAIDIRRRRDVVKHSLGRCLLTLARILCPGGNPEEAVEPLRQRGFCGWALSSIASRGFVRHAIAEHGMKGCSATVRSQAPL